MEHIDFDEASREWRKNKVSFKKGYFKYKCTKEGCSNILYSYVTNHTCFALFATEFDLHNKDNPAQHTYCEEHLQEQHT